MVVNTKENPYRTSWETLSPVNIKKGTKYSSINFTVKKTLPKFKKSFYLNYPGMVQ